MTILTPNIKSLVLKSIHNQWLPTGRGRAVSFDVLVGDVALVEKKLAMYPNDAAGKAVGVSYDLRILRTGELARDVPAYQVAIYWQVVASDDVVTSAAQE
jgi:hypothetical protein